MASKKVHFLYCPRRCVNKKKVICAKNFRNSFNAFGAIVSVSYRVNSKQGTRFRIWATKRLKNYLAKGFAFNEKRLKEYKENLFKFYIRNRATPQLSLFATKFKPYSIWKSKRNFLSKKIKLFLLKKMPFVLLQQGNIRKLWYEKFAIM